MVMARCGCCGMMSGRNCWNTPGAVIWSPSSNAATRIIAAVLNRLHHSGKGASGEGLFTLRRRFRSLFDRAGDSGAIFARAAHVAGDLMHHENVRHRPGRGWLAIDPKGLYGERTFDAANVLCNPVALPEVVRDEARLLRHAALSASWSLDDGADASHALHMARLAEAHLPPIS